MSTTEKVYRITIKQGQPLAGYLRVWDGDRSRGILKDLTGYTAKMQFRADVADTGAPVLLEPLVSVGTFTPQDRYGNVVICNVSFEATANQTRHPGLEGLGDGRFEIQISDPYGRPWKTIQGIAVLKPEVVR